MPTNTDIIIRIMLTLILSSLIGFERVAHQKTAGSYFRMNILVGLGSTLAMLLSFFLNKDMNTDLSRIAGQVLTGIGFLGAGVIIKSQVSVHGLTMAATIWLVSAIGLAVGAGYYFAAILTTLIAIVVLLIFRKIDMESERKLNK